MPEAIIADLDGLLSDSEPLWHKVELAVFPPLGVPLTDERCLETTGLRLDEGVDYWYARYPWEGASKAEVVARLARGVAQLIETRGQAKPGLGHFLALIRAMGFRAAIATSSPPEVMRAVVVKLDLGSFFRVIYSAVHEPYGKPHPAVYLAAAQKLGALPTECIAFEDSPNGVIAANAARMRCVAVPDPRVRDRPEFGIADLVLSSLEELTKDMLAGA